MSVSGNGYLSAMTLDPVFIKLCPLLLDDVNTVNSIYAGHTLPEWPGARCLARLLLGPPLSHMSTVNCKLVDC